MDRIPGLMARDSFSVSSPEKVFQHAVLAKTVDCFRTNTLYFP